MGLATFIRKSDDLIRGLSLSLPGKTRLKKAVSTLKFQVETIDQIEIEDVDEFVLRTLQDWRTTDSIQGLSQRDLRSIARYVMTKTRDGQTLSDGEGLLDSFFVHIEKKPRSLVLRNLTYVYLAQYDPEWPYFSRLVSYLQSVDEDRKPSILKRLCELGLIDSANGPKKLARAIKKNADRFSAAKILDALNLTNGLEVGDFAGATFSEFCKLVVAAGAREPNLIHRLLEWGRSGGGQRETFPKRTPEFIRALLVPWVDSGLEPSKNLEREISNFLLDTLGDPRFSKSSLRWNSIDENAKAYFIRLLNKASVTQFFDVVTQTMNSQDAKRMWRYRRKFWSAYLPYIDHAWVVFGPTGQRLARQMSEDSEDKSYSQFGIHRAEGADSSHAVLIMSIGDLVIAEWSHNGKCRMWSKDVASAPKLYNKSTYRVRDLRNGEWWEKSHTGNENYSWQRTFADKIRRHTGVAMTHSEYAVR